MGRFRRLAHCPVDAPQPNQELACQTSTSSPAPRARPEGAAIDDYLEFAGDKPIDGTAYKTQKEAIDAAKAAGLKPLASCVRHTEKGKPEQWLEA